jgi:protein gp37
MGAQSKIEWTDSTFNPWVGCTKVARARGANMNQETLRAALIQYWSDKVMALGLPRARHSELIKGDHGQRLYWLILLARNDLAHNLWESISSAAKAPSFDF